MLLYRKIPDHKDPGFWLSHGNIFVQGSADSAGTGEQFSSQGLDFFAEADFVQICTKYICPGIQLFQTREVLNALLHFQTGNDLLQFSKQGIRGGGEGLAVVTDTGQIPGITGQHQGSIASNSPYADTSLEKKGSAFDVRITKTIKFGS